MDRRGFRALAGCVALVALVAAGCGGGRSNESASGGSTSGNNCSKTDNITLQSKWVVQAQFAGYYAAKAKGFYDDRCLNVTIRPGGPDITPEQVVQSGQAQFGIDWLPSLLATRDQGGNLVNIAQVFGRSGVTLISFKDSGVSSITAMRGKKVGVWCCGNQYEQYAAMTKNGIDPNNRSDVTIVNQPFSMDLFLNRDVEAASAMTYNELAQVLETKDPNTGQLYKPSQLNVFKMQNEGTGMLEDGVFVRGDWIASQANQDIAKRFLAASFRGWIYCRDHQSECVQIVLDNGPTLGKGHQTWMMNEINALIWPARRGIGVMDAASYLRTVHIALQYNVIKKAPSSEAYRPDLAKAADEMVANQGIDTHGDGWQKLDIKVTPGGK